MIAAVDGIYDALKTDGIRVLVYGPSDKYESLTDVMKKCSTEQPDTTARAGWQLVITANWKYTYMSMDFPACVCWSSTDIWGIF